MTELSLHEQLKDNYSDGGGVEETVDGYRIDVVHRGLLIEIQTANFSSIKPKLRDLLQEHRVRLVHPIPYMKWIIKLDQDGKRVSRRRSPKRGKVEEVFYELVYIAEIPTDPNFELEVAMVNAEEFWMDDGEGSWRRNNWSIHDRRLLNIRERHLFTSPSDYLRLLPKNLSNRFTTRQLLDKADISTKLARKMIYCLRKMGGLGIHGKNGRANIYEI
ncbi:MAG: hypothetical protein ACLFVP_06420 [Candidatus Bathyarchaeia archaeon]